ncbi:lipase 3 precursor [Metarhizium brunneum]
MTSYQTYQRHRVKSETILQLEWKESWTYKPNTWEHVNRWVGNAAIDGLEALRNRRDACLKAKNPDSEEIREVTKMIRNLEKKASKNAEPKRSTKEAVKLATKGADKASKAEAYKAKKAYKAKAAK